MNKKTDETLHRRLTADTLTYYFRTKTPVTLAVEGVEGGRLVIDGKAETLALWVPAEGEAPDVEEFARLQVDTETGEGGDHHVLTAFAEGDHFETYSLFAAVIEDVVRGTSLRTAVSNSVETYRSLLLSRGRLSTEKAVGLVGELLVLEHLLDNRAEDAVMSAWVGPEAEEHDFVLTAGDLEVKSTISERRVHLIGSETQLARTGDRPLWLISIQLTRGGRAEDAFTLPELVTRIRARMSSPTTLDTGLDAAGYRGRDAGLYRETYLLRTEPRAYLVDDDFPAITRERLAKVPRQDLVTALSYRVDVTTLPTAVPPSPMESFVEVEK